LRDGAQLAFGSPAEVLRLPVTPVAKPHVVRQGTESQRLAVGRTAR
jgi:ATP-binding cassette subfamily C protein